MLQKLKILLTGAVAAVFAQTVISLAETWSFGPSLQPLQMVLGWLTFPVVTVVSLGIPVAAVYFGAARWARLATLEEAALLVTPFVLLQLASLTTGALNFYAFFYPAAFSAIAVTGIAVHRRAAQKG